MNNTISKSSASRRSGHSVLGLVIACAVGMYAAVGSSAVMAQSTAGHIFGKAPAGDSVVAKSTTSGANRHATVDSKGRYNLGHLPTGVYTVILEENGTPVVKRLNVQVIVGRGINVNFDCAEGGCAAK